MTKWRIWPLYGPQVDQDGQDGPGAWFDCPGRRQRAYSALPAARSSPPSLASPGPGALGLAGGLVPTPCRSPLAVPVAGPGGDRLHPRWGLGLGRVPRKQIRPEKGVPSDINFSREEHAPTMKPAVPAMSRIATNEPALGCRAARCSGLAPPPGSLPRDSRPDRRMLPVTGRPTAVIDMGRISCFEQ